MQLPDVGQLATLLAGLGNGFEEPDDVLLARHLQHPPSEGGLAQRISPSGDERRHVEGQWLRSRVRLLHNGRRGARGGASLAPQPVTAHQAVLRARRRREGARRARLAALLGEGSAVLAGARRGAGRALPARSAVDRDLGAFRATFATCCPSSHGMLHGHVQQPDAGGLRSGPLAVLPHPTEFPPAGRQRHGDQEVARVVMQRLCDEAHGQHIVHPEEGIATPSLCGCNLARKPHPGRVVHIHVQV
mmetsp:Transcript_121256/g.387458  ORF Transcript_121256/g.387458 Transcript_121256/m.387458 type:complete len:246 (+) Transcript_121256:777-1514(+)